MRVHNETHQIGLRIGVDGRELLPDLTTGIGRYLRNFLTFAVHAHPEHQFFVYGNQPLALTVKAPNLHHRIVPEYLTSWWDQVVLVRQARKDALDVLLSPYDKGPLFAPFPVVLTIHDLLFLAISERGPFGKFFYNGIYLITRRLFVRRAMRIITDSEYSKKDIVTRLGVPQKMISHVPIGVSTSYHPDQPASDLKAFEIRNGINLPYILYVGNFKPHKNVKTLLQAYATLPDTLRSSHQLVLCGRRDRFRDEIQHTVKRLKLNAQVVFIDFVDEADMPLLYSGAEVFAFPSLYEGFGLPPLEAMACGTPVVSSRATSLPEVVGNAGILVDARVASNLRQGIETLLTRADHRKSLVQAGLNHARNFSLELAAEEIMNVLKQASSVSRGTPP